MNVHEAMMQASGSAMVIGGTMAQKSTDIGVGTAGVIVATAGLVTAAYPWFKAIMDSIQSPRKIAELEGRILATNAEAERKITEAKHEADLIRARDKLESDRKLMEAHSEYESRASVLEGRLAHYEETSRARFAHYEETSIATSDRRHLQMEVVTNDLEALKIRAEENTGAIEALAAKAVAGSGGDTVPGQTFTKFP